jgi:hypothetical protein
MRPLSLLLASFLLAGCAAGRSTYYLWTAEREFAVAAELEAESRAVYEYTLAHEHLLKAREEHGYSDYKNAETLAKSSAEWSARASAVAEYGTSERDLMLQEMGDQVPDEASTVEEEYETPLGITEE